MGTVAANIIMFISILTVGAALVIVFNQHTQETVSAMSTKTDALKASLETDITITNVLYNSTSNQTTVNALNTGTTELKINSTDVFINGVFIPRDVFKQIYVIPSTSIRNSQLWDPNEVLEIVVNKTLPNETTHTLDLVTQYGVRDSEVFSN